MKRGLGTYVKNCFLLSHVVKTKVMECEMEVELEGHEVSKVLANSLHAMSTAPTPESMRIHMHLGKTPTLVLIDLCSTHNLVNSKLASNLVLIDLGSTHNLVVNAKIAKKAGLHLLQWTF